MHRQWARTTTSLPNCSRRTCCRETVAVMFTPLVHPVITVNKIPQILPEQCSIQVTGVKVTLDPSLPALVQLTGFIALQWRRVFIHPLTDPLGKSWETPRLWLLRQTHKQLVSNNSGETGRLQHFLTNRVASLHLIDRCLRGRKPGISPAVTKLDKQPFVGRTTEMTLTEVTAICPRRNFLVLQVWFLLM